MAYGFTLFLSVTGAALAVCGAAFALVARRRSGSAVVRAQTARVLGSAMATMAMASATALLTPFFLRR